MSISTSKRKREEECIEDENNSDERSGESSQENLGNGDTVVFSTLVPMITDVSILKNCRLVCKSWNDFACQAWRKLPGIYYTVNEPSAQDEHEDKGLLLFENNQNMELPSPFRNFSICAKGFRNPRFLKFLKYLRKNPNNDYFIQLRIASSDVDPQELQTALTANHTNFKITQLTITSRIRFGDGPAADNFQPEKIRLPFLNSLIIGFGGLENDQMLILVENICHFSPLKSLDIRCIKCVDKLEKALSSGGMQSIEKFSFNYSTEQMSPENWNRICRRIMEIPAIKNLNLIFRMLDFNKDWAGLGLERIIGHYAHSLVALTVDCLPMIKHISFPQLSEITYKLFPGFERDFSLPVGRFHLLKKVTIGFPRDWPWEDVLECPQIEEQSPGIEELTIIAEANQYPAVLLSFICGAGRVFPNVTTFSLISKARKMAWNSLLLKELDHAFPKLSTVHLEAARENNLSAVEILSYHRKPSWMGVDRSPVIIVRIQGDTAWAEL